MKKLGFLALLLSVSVASIGCEPAKKKTEDKKTTTTETKTEKTETPPVDPAKEAPKS